jgi:hypothetical protein
MKYNKIKKFDNFISEFARELHIQYKYQIYINGIFKLNVYSDKFLDNTIYKDIICKWLKYFYEKYSLNEKITLYIGLFDNKRLFTKDILENDYIPKEQVNGGVTYKYSSKNKIEVYIYRKEEFERLLVHELIHAFNLDISYMNFNKNIFGGFFSENINDKFRKLFIDDIFKLKSKDITLYPYFFEIYTQSFTIYLMCKINKLNIEDFRKHLMPICCKIIDYHNKIGYYKEKTSVLSYYFGVNYLLCNWNNFKNYIDKNQYIYIDKKQNIYIDKKQNNIDEFINLLKEGKQIFIKNIHNNKFKLNDSLKLTPT